MECVYPAVFHKNDDGSYTVIFPDLPGCISEGKTLGNALRMAESALSQWLTYLAEKKQEIPPASVPADVRVSSNDAFVNLVCVVFEDTQPAQSTVFAHEHPAAI